jgi:hypothetical protein
MRAHKLSPCPHAVDSILRTRIKYNVLNYDVYFEKIEAEKIELRLFAYNDYISELRIANRGSDLLFK